MKFNIRIELESDGVVESDLDSPVEMRNKLNRELEEFLDNYYSNEPVPEYSIHVETHIA